MTTTLFDNVEHTREWYTSHRKLIWSLLPRECACCHSEATIVHHVKPLVLGGTNFLSNMLPVCSDCHTVIHGGIPLSALIRAGKERPKREPQQRELGITLSEADMRQRERLRVAEYRRKNGAVSRLEQTIKTYETILAMVTKNPRVSQTEMGFEMRVCAATINVRLAHLKQVGVTYGTLSDYIEELKQRRVPLDFGASRAVFTSQFKGVSKSKDGGFISQITVGPKDRRYLGWFRAEVEAAFAVNIGKTILGRVDDLNTIPPDAITHERRLEIERLVSEKLEKVRSETAKTIVAEM